MAIKLVIDASDARFTTVTQELDQSLITFGRSKSCHIELDHEEVSRRHCIIKFIDGIYLLFDEGSRHGTMLDGEKIEGNNGYPLGSEHQITVPGFSITLQCDGKTPRFEKTTVVARKLLDELLQGEVPDSELIYREHKDDELDDAGSGSTPVSEQEKHEIPVAPEVFANAAHERPKKQSVLKAFDRFFLLSFVMVLACASVVFFDLL